MVASLAPLSGYHQTDGGALNSAAGPLLQTSAADPERHWLFPVASSPPNFTNAGADHFNFLPFAFFILSPLRFHIVGGWISQFYAGSGA
jgi:hypothetical protein